MRAEDAAVAGPGTGWDTHTVIMEGSPCIMMQSEGYPLFLTGLQHIFLCVIMFFPSGSGAEMESKELSYI